MSYKKIIFFLCSFCVSSFVCSQSRYAENLKMLVENDWKTISCDIFLTPLDKKHPTEFQLKCKDKATRKKIKNFALYLQHNDTLYINPDIACNAQINSGSFTKAYHISDSTLLFTNYLQKVPKFYAGVGSAVIPIGVNPFTNPYKLENRFCFIINTNNKYTEVDIVTPEMAEEWLSPFPELLDEYRNLPEKGRGNADILLEIFYKAGILK